MTRHFSLLLIALCLPFILWAVGGILPTFDDYTTLQSPWWVQIADPGYFFADCVRRPFDALLGFVVGSCPALFPMLNHVLIILGHAASACLVYTLCKRLQLGTLAANVATLFFFFSPATLRATLACDGFNQTYAQLWGLLSLWAYLSKRRWLWMVCLVMAALSKENGLAWAIVPPIVAYAFHLAERRQALRHVAAGLLVAAAYLAVFFTITYTGILPVEYDEQYTQATLVSHLKDFAQLMAYTWVPLDFVSLVYEPSRNWLVVAATMLLSMPFLLLLACQWRQLKTKQLLALVACFLILVSPHLVTLVSIMHNYAALSMAALIVAFLVGKTTARYLPLAFGLYLAAAIATDVHHYAAARQSGLLGRQMAMQAIREANGRPIQRALCINIDDDTEPRYSNFCVRPVDAFGWGLSVRHYTGYTWQTTISEATLPRYDAQQVKALADSALSAGCEAVWVAGATGDSLMVLSH